MHSFFIKTSLLVVAGFLLCQCSGSANNNLNGRANTLNANVARAGDPGKVEGNMPSYAVLTPDLKYLQTIEVPTAKIMFKDKAVELPSGAKDILATHWKDALAFYHKNYFDKPKDANDLYDRQRKWSNYTLETGKKLEALSISAPDGSRNVAPSESRAICTFLNQSASSVIDRVKEQASQ